MAKYEKWAAYGITGKRMNSEKTRIVEVEVREDFGASGYGTPFKQTRQQVIDAIDRGYTFCTARYTGEWVKGAMVRKVATRSGYYLRTDANSTEADNLENLPEI